ncbi:glycosyltransferase family 4 protein [uncultured Traorella sp.]|uniref:glycosyltransferase family 4 protein n=1 Tax=uncultured Traorella sp. TaxID=1929048 RepID=UPI0025F9084B|nr:glycosyltransferase family 4 protein [uncultured Traorella sp.]
MFQNIKWHISGLIKSIITLQRTICLKTDSKSVLVVSHALNESGASLVLMEAVELLQKKGFKVVLVSPDVGSLENAYRDMGVTVFCSVYFRKIIRKKLGLKKWCMVFVNTLIMYDWVEEVNNSPILWWIHEGRTYIKKYVKNISISNKKNLYTYCVSDWSRKCLANAGFPLQIGLLYYATKDNASKILDNTDNLIYFLGKKNDSVEEVNKKKIHFILIGSICKRKRNNDFIDAIQMLSREVLDNSEFTIIGKKLSGDDEYYIQFLDKLKSSVKSINYIPTVPHNKINEIYKKVNVVVATSDDDPLPVVVTEGLLNSRCVLLSSNCGQYDLICDGKNGYTFQAMDIKELKDKIEKVYKDRDRIEEIGKAGRKIYDCYFTIDRFNNLLGEEIDKIIGRSV